MVRALINGLMEICRCNPKAVILIVDDKEVYDAISEKYPDKVLNVGISECNAISVAAGLSSCEYMPYVIGGNTFMAYRAYEFIRDQLCMQNRNVKVIGIGAGLAIGIYGQTHQATEDVGCMRSLPNLTVITPATPKEVFQAVVKSTEWDAPSFIRVGRASGEDFYNEQMEFQPFNIQEIKKGKHIAVFAMGSIVCDVIQASDILHEKGIEIGIFNVHTIKPLDLETLSRIGEMYSEWISVEEHNVIGGLASALSDAVIDKGWNVRLRKIGLKDEFAKGGGTYNEMKEMNGLAIEDIVQACSETGVNNSWE